MDANNNLFPVWQQVELLIDQGISVIPVRDRDETSRSGKVYAKKTPYAEWEQYQREIITKHELFAQLEKRNTAAVAIVCGLVSGNLEIIDIDVKWYPGIDSILFTTLKELYPEIYEILRLHGTPSGGCHILYRVSEGVIPGNKKLAGRPSTGDELLAAPKQKNKYFVESRGTGGYAVAPPSLGYVIRRNVPIPTLTWQQRCALIELCKAFDQTITEAAPYKPTKRDESYYDETPFEHFNRTADPVELLQRFNWKFEKQTAGYIWFTKPNGKKGDVHGSFNKTKEVFHVFTTNTDIEGDRAYKLSTVLSHYQFNGDKKQTYQWLVQNGYGKIKPHIENRIVKTHAISGQPLPANASPEAQVNYIEARANLSEAHPHGIFWQPNNDEDGFVISRLHLKECAIGLGFRLHNGDVVRIVKGIIYKQTDRDFYDSILEYINEEDAEIYEKIYNATDAHLQKNGKWIIDNLIFLEQEKILIDTRYVCYKYYNNGIVKITRDNIYLIEYDSVLSEHLIWADKIQPRDYMRSDCKGVFTEFLNLAVDLQNNKSHVMNCMGWLAHEYKNSATAYIIVFIEKCADPKDGGGSGKNVLCELLQYTTTFGSVAAGQKRQMDGINLLQAWNGEKVFALSDVKKDFDFEMLKEPSSGKAIVKKLFKDERSINTADVPKFIVLTNFSYEVTDGGLKRRIVPVEFTNFFTKSKGVGKHFGKHFPIDWGANDWLDYDNFICDCVQHWLNHGLELEIIELDGTGWEKQFVFTYGTVINDFIKENWEHFKTEKIISNVEFNRLLETFMNDNGINVHKFKPNGIKMNKALDEWCKKHGWFMQKNVVERVGLSTERCRHFYEEAPF